MDEHHDFDPDEMPVEDVELLKRFKELGIDFERNMLKLDAAPAHFHEVALACIVCGTQTGVMGCVSSQHGTYISMHVSQFLSLLGTHIAHVITDHTKGLQLNGNARLDQANEALKRIQALRETGPGRD